LWLVPPEVDTAADTRLSRPGRAAAAAAAAIEAETRPTRGRPAGLDASESAVVIDVLRATTTLTVAMSHGALRVVPVATPEEALAWKRAAPEVLACGERDGRMVPGFDLGNSPLEYAVTAVRGRTLVFASTNGSLALLAARSAQRRLLAAFVNLDAVVERLAGERRVAIVCAGKDGGLALEDAACAGLLCARLERRGATLEGPGAALAKSLAPAGGVEVRGLLQGCAHGRYLRTLGAAFARDVEFCAGLDTLDAVHQV
jgi:2-phosphosulfolactate phosphatase